MSWIILVIIYGLLKGSREIFKKNAMEKNSVIEVLFFYTLIGFVMLLPETPKVLGINKLMLPWVFVKSFVIFVAWILGFKAVKELPVSLYGILDLSRVLLAYILGMLVLHETLSTGQLIGMPLVVAGLLGLKFLKTKKTQKENVNPKFVIYTLTSCALNAVSGLLDKILMTKDMTSGELQYWFMLFNVLLYGIYMLVKREKPNMKALVKNYWVYILSISFIIGDRCLFIANADPASKITVMTLLKQSSCFVTIFAGKFVYNEKNIGKKVICAAVILAGIIIAVLI